MIIRAQGIIPTPAADYGFSMVPTRALDGFRGPFVLQD